MLQHQETGRYNTQVIVTALLIYNWGKLFSPKLKLHFGLWLGDTFSVGPGCSKQRYDKTGLVRNLNSDMKAYKSNSVLFFLSTIRWLHFLKRAEEITRENAFEQTKNKWRLKFSPALAVIGLPTTRPCTLTCTFDLHLTYCQATTLSLFFFILQSNQESHEHLKYFRNVYCVMTNYSKDCLSCSISIQWITQLVSEILVHWIVIYQVDSAIRHLNNQGQGTLTSHKTTN